MSARSLALCTLVLALCGTLACAAPPAGIGDADRSAIRDNESTFTKSAIAKDFGKMVSLYTEDAALLPPNGPAVQGREAIQKWMAQFPPMSTFTIDAVDIDGRGDLAYVRGNYNLTMNPPGAAPASDRGKFVEIWRKQSDGSWKMKWDIFNSDLPPAPPPAQ